MVQSYFLMALHLLIKAGSRWGDSQSDLLRFPIYIVLTAPAAFSNHVVIYVVYVDIHLITIKSVFIQHSNNIRRFLSHSNYTAHRIVYLCVKKDFMNFFFFLLSSISRIFQKSPYSFFKKLK